MLKLMLKADDVVDICRLRDKFAFVDRLAVTNT